MKTSKKAGKALRPVPKLYDTPNIAPGGKIEDHWEGNIYQDVFGNARKGKKVPDNFLYADQNFAVKYFDLKGFEYGNWLNQHDRRQYLVGCTVSLFDMASIIGFKPKQIGLKGKVSIAFGARGTGGTLAHFEPSTFAINITRYKNDHKGFGERKFLASGGKGSMGHEWSHALDFYLGRHVDKSTPLNFLSHIITGRMVRHGNYFTISERPKTELTKAFFNLMLKIMYEPVKGKKGQYKYNKFYGPLLKIVEDPSSGMGVYWIQKHELFARAFEVYLYYKGVRKRVSNPFLKKTKYQAVFYSSQKHYKTWEKEMDILLHIASRNGKL